MRMRNTATSDEKQNTAQQGRFKPWIRAPLEPGCAKSRGHSRQGNEGPRRRGPGGEGPASGCRGHQPPCQNGAEGREARSRRAQQEARVQETLASAYEAAGNEDRCLEGDNGRDARVESDPDHAKSDGGGTDEQERSTTG